MRTPGLVKAGYQADIFTALHGSHDGAQLAVGHMDIGIIHHIQFSVGQCLVKRRTTAPGRPANLQAHFTIGTYALSNGAPDPPGEESHQLLHM